MAKSAISIADRHGGRRPSHLIWDTQNIVAELDSGNTTVAAYTLAPQGYGALISQRRSGATSYHHGACPERSRGDALGSTDRLTDASQAALITYLYRGFGQQSILSGSSSNPFTWLGRMGYYRQSDAGNYWVRARTYQPTIGRFLSLDPAHEGENLYSYVLNQPVLLVDPSGLVAETSCNRVQYFDGYKSSSSIVCSCPGGGSGTWKPRCVFPRKSVGPRGSGPSPEDWKVEGLKCGCTSEKRGDGKCEGELVHYWRGREQSRQQAKGHCMIPSVCVALWMLPWPQASRQSASTCLTKWGITERPTGWENQSTGPPRVERQMGWATCLGSQQVKVHRSVLPSLEMAGKLIKLCCLERDWEWVNTMTGFNWRKARKADGTRLNSISNHAAGHAIDLSPDKPPGEQHIPFCFAKVMEGVGWLWSQREFYGRTRLAYKGDDMHWEHKCY